MQPLALPPIAWSAPWFAPMQPIGQPVQQHWLAGHTVAEALHAQPHLPVRFVPQAELPAGMAYESFIFQTGHVPTRDNLHDFFNGLIWLHYPETKRRLNQLQAEAIAMQGVGAVRGPVRDAITVLDENGALLDAPELLWQALLARDWQRLLVDLRPLWTQARLYLLGHALLEKLVQPRKSITAHVYRPQTILAPHSSGAAVDRWLAQELAASHLATKPFTPLPVLGVPGWWAESENFSFYDDSDVFRSPRRG